MTLWLWDGKLLTEGGALAIDERCCCGECNCDSVPDTLYLHVHQIIAKEPYGTTELKEYDVTLNKVVGSDPVTWEGIWTAKYWDPWHGPLLVDTVEKFELYCRSVIAGSLSFTCAHFSYQPSLAFPDVWAWCEGTSIGTVNPNTYVCPDPFFLSLEGTGSSAPYCQGWITEFWITDT